MADAGALFLGGMEVGLRARRQREARQEDERTRGMRDMERQVDLRRKQQLANEFELELQARKQDAANYVEAEKAFGLYQEALGSMDQGSPQFPEAYRQATLSYLPTILKNPGVAKKWEAVDGVTKQGQAFTLRKAREASMIGAVREAADLGIVNVPTTQDGQPDITALQELMTTRLQEIDDQRIKERQASHGTTRQTQGIGLKVKVQAEAQNLEEINKQLLDRNATPEKRQWLLAEKSRTIKNIDRLERMSASQGGSVEPQSAPIGAPESGEVVEPSMPDAPVAPRGGPKAPTAPRSPGQSQKSPMENGYGVFEMDGYKVRIK